MLALVINTAAPTPARQAAGLALVLLVFAGIAALLGSEKLKPSTAGRYAQARGRWQAMRWMRWPLLIAGIVVLVAALILNL